ncbi:hypothetical protein [Kitasatospora sp. NPDC091207]|uniref:hypothetical protein n=1 Tax=Kitasatospora sp. NPDC091207 TaxID=3364083 RepID=UPI0037F48670
MAGSLRRRPEVVWSRCPVCDWIGRRRNGADPELRTPHRYRGRDAIRWWCGGGDHGYEEAAEPSHGHGRPGRLVTDLCLDCGRAGTWFRADADGSPTKAVP